jgi:hypothetical protein
VERPRAIGWAEVWAVIKASALQRIGRRLLLAHLVLALFGVVVVTISIVVMQVVILRAAHEGWARNGRAAPSGARVDAKENAPTSTCGACAA